MFASLIHTLLLLLNKQVFKYIYTAHFLSFDFHLPSLQNHSNILQQHRNWFFLSCINLSVPHEPRSSAPITENSWKRRRRKKVLIKYFSVSSVFRFRQITLEKFRISIHDYICCNSNTFSSNNINSWRWKVFRIVCGCFNDFSLELTQWEYKLKNNMSLLSNPLITDSQRTLKAPNQPPTYAKLMCTISIYWSN